MEEKFVTLTIDGVEVKDIKFSVSCSVYSDEQIFCFSAMILYESKADSSK